MSSDQLSWSFGLRNSDGKYLTVETFQDKVNCSAAKMKKKQIFFLEQDAGSGAVYIRTWAGKYLGVDDKGTVTASSTEKGADNAITIDPQDNGSWCLLSQRAQYIHGTGDKIKALIERELAPNEPSKFFTVALAMHPQVCILNINRKRYLHFSDSRGVGAFTCDENIPWGDDAVINLDFNQDGTYSLQSARGTYLSADGALTDSIGEDNKFVLVFMENQLAFKSKSNGKYLTCAGMDGVTKALKPSIGKDELFVLEDSRPQVKLTASTGLKVSIKGGIEVSANQKETTDTEIYQLESAPGGKWALKCNTSLYWGVDDSGAVKAESKDKNESSLFTVKWLDNKIALVASNGKVVTVKGNKQLQATQDLSADIPEESQFVYELINRPRLVLRGHWGFVGEMEKSKKLECNKSTYETLSMHIKAGVCEIKAASGYLKISDDRSEVTATGASPTGLFMEIVDDTTMALKYKDASGDVHYMQGDQNGGTNFLGSGLTEFTLWEF